MKARFLFLAALAFAFCPEFAQADAYPDFDSDARPLLARQPGLIEYVRAHFEVKEKGVARIPGHGDALPQPPFIFNARPKGHTGPFYLALLIQPGTPGHIMKVADVRKLPIDDIPPQQHATPASVPAQFIPAPAAVSAAPQSQPLAPPPDASDSSNPRERAYFRYAFRASQ